MVGGHRDVLRTGLSTVRTRLPAVEFGEERAHGRALGEEVAVRPVVAVEVVLPTQMRREARRDGFLPDAEVDRTLHLVGRVVLANERFLAQAQSQHEAKE